MAILISEDCIVCAACEPECPNQAIYETGASWTWGEGTQLAKIKNEAGEIQSADVKMPPLSDEIYFIVPGKCTECLGFHEEPQCALVCPTEACVPDPDYVETEADLWAKKAWLYQEAS